MKLEFQMEQFNFNVWSLSFVSFKLNYNYINIG